MEESCDLAVFPGFSLLASVIFGSRGAVSLYIPFHLKDGTAPRRACRKYSPIKDQTCLQPAEVPGFGRLDAEAALGIDKENTQLYRPTTGWR